MVRWMFGECLVKETIMQMNKVEREHILDVIARTTAECFFGTGEPERAKTGLGDRLLEFLRSEDVDPALMTKMTKLCSAVAGEDLEAPLRAYMADQYMVGAAVVCVGSPNHHSYPLGQCCLVTQVHKGHHSGIALRPDGRTGNDLPRLNEFPPAVRAATGTEVENFLIGLTGGAAPPV